MLQKYLMDQIRLQLDDSIILHLQMGLLDMLKQEPQLTSFVFYLNHSFHFKHLNQRYRQT